MTALVLDGDCRAALAIIRSLGRAGVRVIVASVEPKSLAGSSKYCSQRLVCPCPRNSPEKFGDWLITKARKEKNMVIFSSSDATLAIVNRVRERLPESTQIVLPPAQAIEVALNKAATLDLACSLGIPVPRSMEICCADRVISKWNYPVVIKSARADVADKPPTAYATDAKSLDAQLLKWGDAGLPVLVQEVVRGEGTGIFAFFENGEPAEVFAHRRIREKPPWGGVSVLSESIKPPSDTLDYAMRLLRELKWNGIAMVEFKRDADGVPRLMEINARFWGSLELAIRAGADFPMRYYQMGVGYVRPDLQSEPKLSIGDLQSQTHLSHKINRWALGELDSMITAIRTKKRPDNLPHSRVRSILNYIADLRYGPKLEIESITDPKPALFEYSRWLKQTIGKNPPTPNPQPPTPIRGLLHAHTSYSHDGRLSIADLADLCRSRGFDFIAITDHAEDVDEEQFAHLIEECDRASSSDFLVIPGLEHRSLGGVHILSIGQRNYADGSIEELRESGSVLIGAHYGECRDNRAFDLAQNLHAIEVWNIGRHTRYLPPSREFQAYRRCRKRNPDLLAVGGLDMHKGCEWGCEIVMSADCGLSESDILSKIRQGDFVNRGRFVSFSPSQGHGVGKTVLAAGDTLMRIRDLRDLVLAKRKTKG